MAALSPDWVVGQLITVAPEGQRPRLFRVTEILDEHHWAVTAVDLADPLGWATEQG